MKYYVHHPDGQRYGPVELETLNQWFAQSRVLADTEVEEDLTGYRMPLRLVPGWGPTSAPPVWSNPDQPRQFGPTSKEAEMRVNVSWILSGISYVMLPIVAAIPAFLLAKKAEEENAEHAGAAKMFAIVSLALQSGALIFVGLFSVMAGFRQ